MKEKNRRDTVLGREEETKDQFAIHMVMLNIAL